MRTLSTQVRLRRLIRAFSQALDRMVSEPAAREMAGSVSIRLLERAAEVREAWGRESLSGRPGEALERYVRDSLRTAELTIAGLAQRGADLKLLARDFDGATLPLEVFLRGLDTEPALQRSA